MKLPLLKRILIDKNICGGVAVITGTRTTVKAVIADITETGDVFKTADSFNINSDDVVNALDYVLTLLEIQEAGCAGCRYEKENEKKRAYGFVSECMLCRRGYMNYEDLFEIEVK